MNPLMNMIDISGGLVGDQCMEWEGDIGIRISFFFRLAYIFIHRNSGQKCGEKYKYLKKKKDF